MLSNLAAASLYLPPSLAALVHIFLLETCLRLRIAVEQHVELRSGDAGTEESVGSCLCSGLAATYLELCTDGQLILDDAIADRACAAAALRCLLAFSPDAKVPSPLPSLLRDKICLYRTKLTSHGFVHSLTLQAAPLCQGC